MRKYHEYCESQLIFAGYENNNIWFHMHNKKKAIGELIAFKNGADFVAKQFDP